MYRLTLERFDFEVLEERRKYKAALRDIPKSALESTLLRQLRSLRVKAVFIPNNSNGNKRSIAFAYFESEEDYHRAKNMSVFYYHNKLSWYEGQQSSQERTIQDEKGQENAEEHFKKGQERRQNTQNSNNQTYDKTRSFKSRIDKIEKGKQKEKTKSSKEHKEEASIMQRIEEHQDMLQEILRKLNNLDNRQVNPAYSS